MSDSPLPATTPANVYRRGLDLLLSKRDYRNPSAVPGSLDDVKFFSTDAA
ncbi:hypothetical protein GCM10020221_06020 [Streptomyces thioluteus]|uniref:Uncharacterized protein n=1 Tax=Streptomyces thioluteus TaxID=66431 RepID=A0ABN3WHL5_STRTU